MPRGSDEKVVVATRFTRLRGGRIEGKPATEADVGYEALATLSEAMNLLGDVLQASSTGAAWDLARNEQLGKRLEELVHCLDDRDAAGTRTGPGSEATDSSAATSSTNTGRAGHD